MPVDVQPDRVVLKHPKGASAEILFYGATVISWKSGSSANPEAAERLFVSSKAAFDGSKPVRGGIPVVFPCFGAPTHPEHSKLSQHGFARSEKWILENIVMDNEAGVSVRFALEPTATIQAKFERPFHLSYVVTLAEHQLSTALHVKNTALSSTSPLEFQALLHNYIRAPSNEVLVSPLQALSYYDKTEATEELRSTPKVETRASVDVKTFTDSVYENARGKYEIAWPSGTLEVRAHNFKDVVVWNPQKEAGSKIGDMEDGGWERYICVEPGYVRGFVKLDAGQTWIGQQALTVLN
ncbi:Glucose-6-phosphate 1-epimerase [Sparassis crispa]|uniref:Glucose-6-phosphate 1-epimerase n=1 Tax=Sparassis crispa TaxID=139825 RepID=A0A401G7R4_9APHY|nr:Glucose-6-phosphate 1-epimerase [Sparassis crispa]GBE78197.1 Glucose-6-phosphate 1-epimerase [Sparassis crispa]